MYNIKKEEIKILSVLLTLNQKDNVCMFECKFDGLCRFKTKKKNLKGYKKN